MSSPAVVSMDAACSENCSPIRRRASSFSRSGRPQVYVTRRIPQKGVEKLLTTCDLKQWDSELAVPRGEFLHSVVSVNGILCMPSDVIDIDIMDAAGPNLQVIATLSHSTEHIDMEECKRRDVDVITVPCQPSDHIAELTVALVLLTIKETLTEKEKNFHFDPPTPDFLTDIDNVVTTANPKSRPCMMRRHSEEQLAFQWSNGKPSNTNCSTWQNIAKKTFGIYGLTKLGMSVIKLLKTFGVEHVIVADCDAELDNSEKVDKCAADHEIVPFEELLTRADIVCVCGSEGERSENVFCRESFKKLSGHAIIITSQSEERAIDYVDLYEALRDGQIKAAGLNDCNQIPVPFKTPLLGLRNCIFLPQTEESVYDIRHKVSFLIAENLSETLKHKMQKMAMIVE